MEAFFSTTPFAGLNQQLAADYESIVWTDRWRSHGDFVMTIKENDFLKQDLRNIYYLLSSESRHVMFIETVEPLPHGLLKVSGRSLESILDYRYLSGYLERSGRPGTIIQEIVNGVLGGGGRPGFALPNFATGAVYTGGSSRTVLVPGLTPLSEIIQGFAEEFDFGYEMVRNASESTILFNTFAGVDRSIRTSSNYVLFNQELNNLTESTSIRSIQGWINHVYARAYYETDPENFNRVTGDFTSKVPSGMSVSGWRLRSKPSDDRDEQPTVGAANAYLRTQANAIFKDLANQYQNLVDGKASAEEFRELNLNLGDIVELMGYFNETTRYFIEEIVHVDDKDGYNIFPTFRAVV